MAFCIKCGTEITDEMLFCPKCGNKVGEQPKTINQSQVNNQQFNPQQNYQYQANNLAQPTAYSYLQTLSGKVKTEAIIWVVIASLQLLLGIILLIQGISLSGYSWTQDTAMVYYVQGLVLIVISIVNYKVSSNDFKYSREVLINPVGIVNKFSPIGGRIGNLIYNILFGGVIGVIGSIFGFVTRSYVMNNATTFNNIEAVFISKNSNVK